MSKYVEPSIALTAFTCPHCGAFTTQYWHSVMANKVSTVDKLPLRPNESHLKTIMEQKEISSSRKSILANEITRAMKNQFFLGPCNVRMQVDFQVYNLDLSRCFNCNKLTIWLQGNLLHPQGIGIAPNADLNEDICQDFIEARTIVDLSPRGAAALLRLALQKLCKQLGESGSNINNDIANLVAKGLNPFISNSLDILRVIGNEAVHPGTMDLRDDRDTATKLFGLINSIAEQMISHPKHVKALYATLPEDKRNAITTRDAYFSIQQRRQD